MKQVHFAILPGIKQLDRLQKHGVYVGKSKIPGSTVLLYQYQSFFVEIFYTHYRKNPAGIRVSSNMSVLDPRLHQVSISLKPMGVF